jgi:uncharacterized cupredoxin-like copper-binding protein
MKTWKIANLPAVAFALCAGAVQTLPAQAQWAHAQPMMIVMVDNRFQPDRLVFQVGTAYALHLVNRGKEMHEFTAPEFLKASKIRETKLLSNGGTDIVVQPGQSVNLTLVPEKKGAFKLICADHDWDGMVGTIAVN